MDFTKEKFSPEIIHLDAKSNDTGLQKRTTKSYATRVFQESTIGMVASIASSHSRARRGLKSLLLTLCVSGFLYQCTTYLLHVFDYPTTIGLDIHTPEHIPVPAYTFCLNNGIKRSIFCNLYPDHCYEPSEKFCSRLHRYCGTNETRMPKEEYYVLERTMNYTDILEWGSNLTDFIIHRYGLFSDNIEGPFLRLKDENRMTGSMICYSLHSVANSPNPSLQIKRKLRLLGDDPIDVLRFFVDETEMFIPGSRPGIFFSIHSPYEAINPFAKGIFMKSGRTYRVYVSMDQEILLKDPFTTKCVNYQEHWEANNRTGPRIQEMCQHKCILEFSMACFNCVAPVVLYDSEHRMCSRDEMAPPYKCTQDDFLVLQECFTECKDDCRVIKYKSEIRDRYEAYPTENDGEDLDEINQTVTVEIFLEASEIMTLKHSPKYMTVEVFSAIGGFIGCWLGISLMDITDFFGSVFIVSSYAWRKLGKK